LIKKKEYGEFTRRLINEGEYLAKIAINNGNADGTTLTIMLRKIKFVFYLFFS